MESPHLASRQRPLALRGFVCLVLAAAAACTSDNLVLPSEGTPTELKILSGNNQSGVVGSVLHDSLSVRVLDFKGRPVVGQKVAFVLAAGAQGALLEPDTVITDADGLAVSHWQLGTVAGGQVTQARLVASPLAANFTASAMPGPALRIVEAGGQAQVAQVGTALPDSLAVGVEDQYGNPVAGVVVQWTAGNGGSVSSPSVATGQDGRSAVRRILGSAPGTYLTTAITAGLDGSPVSFSSTATLGPSPALTITTQPSSQAISGVPFTQQPVIQLRDATGNPLHQRDVAVTAAILLGGGALSGTTTNLTDANGIAAFTNLAITGLPGSHNLIFAASGYTAATSNSISVTSPTPGSIAVSAGNNQTAQVGTPVSVNPSVIVRDPLGAPMPNVTVTFSVQSGGGNITGGTPNTNSAGIASVGSWTLGQTAGVNTLSASVSGSGVNGNPVTFTAVGTPGPISAARSTIAVTPATIQASDKTITATITVTALDVFGNPVVGADVHLSATGSGNDLKQPAAKTGASGAANGTLSSKIAESKTVSATASGVALTQTTTVTVLAGPPDPSRSVANVPDGVAFFFTTITVQLNDEFGNPLTVGGDNVSISVSGANNIGALAVTDRGDGTYEASYRPTFLGDDKVAITVNGAALKGSPFTSKVTLF